MVSMHEYPFMDIYDVNVVIQLDSYRIHVY